MKQHVVRVKHLHGNYRECISGFGQQELLKNVSLVIVRNENPVTATSELLPVIQKPVTGINGINYDVLIDLYG